MIIGIVLSASRQFVPSLTKKPISGECYAGITEGYLSVKTFPIKKRAAYPRMQLSFYRGKNIN